VRLKGAFEDHLASVEGAAVFVPFVGGESERIERCAVAAKRCLGVAPAAALDPWAAAAAVNIDVRGEAFFTSLSAADRRQVLEIGGHCWSAGTIIGGGRAIIVLNPTHAMHRQKATLAEELAHVVIGHPPSRIDATTGFRTYDADVEGEAYGVGGAMILPYGHLCRLVKQGVSATVIAARYDVSERFVNYRINRAGLRRMYAKNVS
jgi:IrrE N-terminal-like domain